MAEAFAALGIAANIFQFLELGFKATQTVITNYRDIDIDGLAQHNAEIASTCSDFEEHCSRLKNDKAVVKDDDLAPLLTRCINTATKLSTEIGRLRVPDSKRHRRRTKMMISIMSYWKSNMIESLQGDLVDIRGQICFRLQGLIYEHHRSLAKSVDTWGEASKEWNRVTEQKLDGMAQQIKDILESESKAEFGRVNELTKALTSFAEEARTHRITRTILESLHFTQIKERQNEIPKAHKDTFEWIFRDDTPGQFSRWLQESSGIFWITGKPGSGKSTLMKFILGHETTRDLSNIWANSKPLLIASHFFWFGGTKMQKSQEGLLRTLLFQILSNAPELTSRVLPDRALGQFKYLESWSLEELSEAFDRLQALPAIPYRIFILVDELDEYSDQGTKLTDFFQTITKSPEIELCCATEGVFFWVSLVVKSLVRGLNNNDGFEILQRRVTEFPPGLDEFFKRMVDSLEGVYRDEYLRETKPFTEDHIETLEKLFPPEVPTDQRSSKKKRRKGAYRKGKNRH
ncbi:hypothetical protein K456DRAFT_1736659 [Colletotrichum gloeosporioides 23]|nr:hypothetical protein K456DRAFT_1736659 [Colletotrichum gloeosporioides 23]